MMISILIWANMVMVLPPEEKPSSDSHSLKKIRIAKSGAKFQSQSPSHQTTLRIMHWVLNPQKGKQRETQRINVPKGWQSVCKPSLVGKDVRTLGGREEAQRGHERMNQANTLCVRKAAMGLGCYWPGFLISLINRNWSEAEQEIRERLYQGPCYSREIKNKQHVPLLACSPRLGELVPYMGWG